MTQAQQYQKERKLFLLNTKKDEGYVYMITSPNFKNWIKIGKTGNIKHRLMQFNCNNPLRNFKVECLKETNKKSVAELLLLNKINENLGIERKGEWIKVKNVNEAKYMFNKHRNRQVTLQDREKCYA